MVKDGPFEALEAEAVHMDYLGREVAAQVYMFGQNPDGSGRLIMESLPHVPEYDLLLLAIKTLDKHVWSRSPTPLWDVARIPWRDAFYLRFGFTVPDWVIENESYCLIHGDPTLANMRFDGIRLRFIDPKPPGNGIPPLASVDLGKIMQSYMGWEIALHEKVDAIGYMPHYVDHQMNPFERFPEDDLRRTMFWCMVHFLRIVHREGQSPLGYWAAQNVRNLQHAIGMENVAIGLGPRWNSGGNQESELSGLQVTGNQPA
jgi:hypothetical protein